MSSDILLAVVREKFKQTNDKLNEVSEHVAVLNEKTERAGEADGFRQYAVADLPFAVDGMTEIRVAFVTDGVDAGETTSNGTGCIAVYKPALDEWRTVYDNTAVIS